MASLAFPDGYVVGTDVGVAETALGGWFGCIGVRWVGSWLCTLSWWSGTGELGRRVLVVVKCCVGGGGGEDDDVLLELVRSWG